MLTRYWNPQDLNDLGKDYDRASFMSGYALGFRQGALVIWEQFPAREKETN